MKTDLEEAKASLCILDLIQNGSKVLPQLLAVGRPGKFSIVNPSWVPAAGMKMVQSKATISDDKNSYSTQIYYYDVPTADSPVTNESSVRVSCTCQEYRTLFAVPNKENDVHCGTAMRPADMAQYEKRNPKHLTGMCRHLMALNRFQRDAGYVT